MLGVPGVLGVLVLVSGAGSCRCRTDVAAAPVNCWVVDAHVDAGSCRGKSQCRTPATQPRADTSYSRGCLQHPGKVK